MTEWHLEVATTMAPITCRTNSLKQHGPDRDERH